MRRREGSDEIPARLNEEQRGSRKPDMTAATTGAIMRVKHDAGNAVLTHKV